MKVSFGFAVIFAALNEMLPTRRSPFQDQAFRSALFAELGCRGCLSERVMPRDDRSFRAPQLAAHGVLVSARGNS